MQASQTGGLPAQAPASLRSSSPYPAQSMADLALFNKAASDALRLQILQVLRRDSFGVLELADIFATTQPGMSHHLKVLMKAGLVRRKREGNHQFYLRQQPRDESNLGGLHKQLFQCIDRTALAADISANLRSNAVSRENNARAFFDTHAEEFAEQQERIAEYQTYAPLIAAMLDTLPDSQRENALELGSGDGRFLAELSPRFRTVAALDISAELLATATQFCAREGLGNVTFLHGDLHENFSHINNVQNIVINMVLHHVASPAGLITELGQLLATGGSLFITELCEHGQDWAREACGDLWLGINPEELGNWANEAGLKEQADSEYLSLRNGFRVQLRHFLKAGNEQTTS